jgi:hypothetical protein
VLALVTLATTALYYVMMVVMMMTELRALLQQRLVALTGPVRVPTARGCTSWTPHVPLHRMLRPLLHSPLLLRPLQRSRKPTV